MSEPAHPHTPSGTVPEISREEFLARRGDRAFRLVDVLPLESYRSGHIPGAISLPLADVASGARKLFPDPGEAIVAYCGGPT